MFTHPLSSYAQVSAGAPESADSPVDLPPKSSEDQASEAQLVTRVAAIRTAFVHRFGTQQEIEAFEHPREPDSKSKSSRAPRLTDLTPARIFDQIFRRVEYSDYYSAPSKSQAVIETAESKMAAAAEQQLDRFIPFGGMAVGAVQQAIGAAQESAVIEQSKDAAAKQYASVIEKALASVLTKEEQSEYSGGDYRTRARLLFQAGIVTLETVGTPNAFIVMVNDPSGIKVRKYGGLELALPGGPGTFFHFYPEELSPAMISGPGQWRIREAERWQLTAHLQRRFMQDGYEAFSKSQASSFLARLNESRYDHSMLLAAFGSTADKQYQAASDDDKRDMEKTAIMMNVAAVVILGTQVGRGR